MLVGGQNFVADLLPTFRQPPFHIVAALPPWHSVSQRGFAMASHREELIQRGFTIFAVRTTSLPSSHPA